MAEHSAYFQVIIFVFIHLCITVSNGSDNKTEPVGGLYCWKRSDISSAMNESCRTQELHPAGIMSSTAEPSDKKNTSDGQGNGTAPTTTLTPQTPGPQVVTRCYSYTNDSLINDTMLKFTPKGASNTTKIKASSVVSVQSCDYQGICDGKPIGKPIQTKLNGTDVTLFCCEGNYCNKEIPRPAKPSSCFQLTQEGSQGKLRGCKSQCHTDAMCMKSSVYLKGEAVVQYKCDGYFNQHECVENQISATGSNFTCKNVTTVNNDTREICCCKGDYCNVPKETFEKVNVTDDNTTCSVQPIHNNPNHNPKRLSIAKKKINWLLVGGVAAGAVVVTLIVVIVVIIVARMKKKARQNNRLTLSYTRLAADRVPDDDEDVQMLLS